MNKQRIFSLFLSVVLVFAMLGTAIPAAMAEGENNRPGSGMRGGMMSVTNDPEIQAVLDANADKFEQHVFDDPDTGISLEYSLYVPDGYDGSTTIPLLMFIPDSSGSGKTARQLVEQYYGAAVWVTEEDQAKHACFVLVPAFSETVVDDNWNVSEQVESAVNLIAQLQKDYAIDANRLYTTGQSMGPRVRERDRRAGIRPPRAALVVGRAVDGERGVEVREGGGCGREHGGDKGQHLFHGVVPFGDYAS